LHRKIIDKFTVDYHTAKNSDGGKRHLLLFADTKPIPPPRKRVDYPDVTIWTKAEHIRACAKSDKGESNGELTAPKPKAKPGRPRKEDQSTGASNIYLQNSDGTQINADQLKALSVAARVAWISLMERDWAPLTFCKMSYEVLRHGRDVHPAWVNVVTAALALKLFGGQVTRAEIMLR
jgi:hypothetical protein